MRKLIPLLLSVAFSAWAGNNCVASASGNMSAISWTSCGGAYPQNGDNINANGFNVTIDASRTFGAYQNSVYGSIRSITVTNGGSGYTNGGSATFSNLSYPSGGMQTATATCNAPSGVVTSITVVHPGVQFVTGTPGIACPGGSGLTAAVDINAGGTAAINAGSGTITIGAGIAVTARGDVSRAIKFQAGASLTIDNSGAPAGTYYWYGADNNARAATWDLTSCTSIAPCTFQGVSPGAAVESNNSGLATANVSMSGSYVTLNNLNGRVTTAGYTYDYVSAGFLNFTHTSFGSGIGQIAYYPAAANFQQQYNTYLNANTNNGSNIVFPSGSCTAKGSYTRIFSDNVLAVPSKAFNGGGGARPSLCGMDMDRNMIESPGSAVAYGAGSTFNDDLYTNEGPSYVYPDFASRFISWTATLNVHSLQIGVTGTSTYTSTITGAVCDSAYRMQAGDDTSNCIITPGNTQEANLTWSVTNSIQSLDISGAPEGELTTIFGAVSSSGNSLIVNHNLELGGALFEDGACHNGAGQIMTQYMQSMQDNILYAPGANTSLYKIHNIDSCSCTYSVNQAGATIGNNYDFGAPASASWFGTGAAACTTKTNGYYGEFSSTPGTTDVHNVNPYLANAHTALGLMPTQYFGITAGRNMASWWGIPSTVVTWAPGTAYAYNAAVIATDSSTYWGLPVLFRCINASGCPANDKPGVTTQLTVGVSNWEFAMKQIFRYFVPQGTLFVDNALARVLPACAAGIGCPITQFAWAWYSSGFIPQNPALWCAGHDGEAVGAVPWCKQGKAMLGAAF